MADSLPAPGPPPGAGAPAPTRGGATGPAPSREDLVAVVLAAGAGARLRPLTRRRPKALCPVANRALVDLAVESVAPVGGAVAVNVHHGRALLEPHLVARRDVHVSVEEPEALGTAGALGHLRDWIDGRGVLVVNADTWSRPDLAGFAADWDGERVRVLVAGTAPFGPRSAVVASLLPWSEVARLAAVPSGLWEVCWRDLVGAGAIETSAYGGPLVDCGTPARYLDANRWAAALASASAPVPGTALLASPRPAAAAGRDEDAIARAGGGSVVHPSAVLLPGATVTSSVIGAGATIGGRVHDSVVWAGNVVHRSEEFVGAIRAGSHLTVLVR